ncbi:hypothetical protein Mp_2g16360 [Marchantia polymorpha subsp. ruderalis]|uniref:Uncharacterized protein n=1 Tax=Marchantia polymorpha TaxID=3197 RepID=A0A2R6W9S2_MARPO|nr:hypothetical protein MARPO_0122s0028 [Marchantia polymorpha]BBN02572.1 hypothetical protein Mp_2g16360 [Marchantia polymorpha subsp. ruderalis]|eukprot:PTQ30597.1 hypothetical protein MARPO_0122s0028 [Marchantia polymorpha]
MRKACAEAAFHAPWSSRPLHFWPSSTCSISKILEKARHWRFSLCRYRTESGASPRLAIGESCPAARGQKVWAEPRRPFTMAAITEALCHMLLRCASSLYLRPLLFP